MGDRGKSGGAKFCHQTNGNPPSRYAHCPPTLNSILFTFLFLERDGLPPPIIDFLASLPVTVTSLKGIVFWGNVPLSTSFNCGPRGRLSRNTGVVWGEETERNQWPYIFMGRVDTGQFSSKYSVEKTPQGRSDVSISLKNYRRKGRENIVGEKKLYFCQAHSFQSHSLLTVAGKW